MYIQQCLLCAELFGHAQYVCVMFYVQCLGQVGRVSLLDESGHPSVRVNGWQWVLHSSCVMLELAEQPEDEMSMNCKV